MVKIGEKSKKKICRIKTDSSGLKCLELYKREKCGFNFVLAIKRLKNINLGLSQPINGEIKYWKNKKESNKT